MTKGKTYIKTKRRRRCIINRFVHICWHINYEAFSFVSSRYSSAVLFSALHSFERCSALFFLGMPVVYHISFGFVCVDAIFHCCVYRLVCCVHFHAFSDNIYISGKNIFFYVTAIFSLRMSNEWLYCLHIICSISPEWQCDNTLFENIAKVTFHLA